MRAAAEQVLTWLVEQARVLRDVPGHVLRWLRSHVSHCIASAWLGGMGVFWIATATRVLAAQGGDAPAVAAPVPRDDGPTERVAMLDVDEINGIRIRRLHALGLAAAGDREAPDENTIQAARATLARGIELDGEQVGTAGKLVVVTRGGIAGWLKRNRGKTADPETLAWLRHEEAAEGGASYAGWADRGDANILNWARERRRSGASRTSDPAGAKDAVASAGREPGTAADATSPAMLRDRAAATTEGAPGIVRADADIAAERRGRDAGSGGTSLATEPPVRDPGSGGAPPAVEQPVRAVGSGDATPDAARDERAARGPAAALAVRGFELSALGGAAAAALVPRPPVDPSPDQLTALRDQIHAVASAGAIAVSVRDHRVVLLLLCDQLFEHAGAELTPQGLQIVRGLSRVLAAERSRAYNVVIDPERALELVGHLVIGGLPPERIEIALKPVDRAIDVVEIEWIDVKDTP
jgi:hypothetical protein